MSPVKKIVVGIDFSDASRAALARAVEIARAFGGEVTLLYALDLSGMFVGAVETYIDSRALAARLREDAIAELRAAAHDADPEGRFARNVEVLEGRPVSEIVEYARDSGADLIVLGTHGRTGIPRFLLGSVAERVVRLAPCDVLVVRGAAASAAAAHGAAKESLPSD